MKLIYFDVRGRGECIRYIMAQGGIAFEEEKVYLETWKDMKPKTLMGAIPELEVDGKRMCQMIAIARFVAKKANLVPKDDLEAARCDMLVDGANELYGGLPAVNFPKLGFGQPVDLEKSKKEYEKYKQNYLVPFLNRYEKFLIDNGTGWFVGNQLTWADLFIAEWLHRVKVCYDTHIMDNHPKLKEFCDRVHSLPNIKKHVETRKFTYDA